LIPAFSAALPFATYQVTANRYTKPNEVPPGGVLVVGSAASGYQIAEDLVQSGWDVYLSVGRHRRVPRRYRGKDFGWWEDALGLSERTADQLPADGRPPLLTGVKGGQDVDLRRLAKDGVTLVGSLRAVDGDRLFFASDLEENLVKGDQGVEGFKRVVDEFVVQRGLAAPVEPRDSLGSAPATSSPAQLEVRAAGITSVVWATGYRYDFGWVHFPVLDARGTPIHRRGVTSVPGLYVLGLRLLHKVKSAFLRGVGDDAPYLAQHIATRA
jgi:putative flavoprotein involved in K+ transport